jgi:hypothetical protein
MNIPAILAPRGGGALPCRVDLALVSVGETPTGQPPGRRRYEIQHKSCEAGAWRQAYSRPSVCGDSKISKPLNRICWNRMCRRWVKDRHEHLLLDPVAATGNGLAGGQRRPGSAAKSIGVPFTAERKGRTYDGSEQSGLFDIAG